MTTALCLIILLICFNLILLHLRVKETSRRLGELESNIDKWKEKQ